MSTHHKGIKKLWENIEGQISGNNLNNAPGDEQKQITTIQKHHLIF